MFHGPNGALKTDDGVGGSLYAHVLVSYIYFSFVLFVVYRELIFYVAIRQAYMHSDMYAPRSSARTILITAIPVKFRSEQALKAVFGETVEHVRVNRKNPKLDKLLKRRNYTAMKLEEAEVALIRRSCHRELRIARWGISEDGGSLFKRWFTRLKRPTHRVRWGKKVDTIEWCRAELAKLNGRVSGLQELQRSGDSGEVYVFTIRFGTFSLTEQVQLGLRLVHQPIQCTTCSPGRDPRLDNPDGPPQHRSIAQRSGLGESQHRLVRAPDQSRPHDGVLRVHDNVLVNT